LYNIFSAKWRIFFVISIRNLLGCIGVALFNFIFSIIFPHIVEYIIFPCALCPSACHLQLYLYSSFPTLQNILFFPAPSAPQRAIYNYIFTRLFPHCRIYYFSLRPLHLSVPSAIISLLVFFHIVEYIIFPCALCTSACHFSQQLFCN
jgi:hypothetical protein